MKAHCFAAGILLLTANVVSAQSYSKAEMLYEHGLANEARKELIDVVFAPGAPTDKPKALLLLGNLALDRNSPKTALSAWNRLIREYPKSPEAKTAKERIPLLSSLIGQMAEESINDSVAGVYLRSADFWSRHRSQTFNIDSSWLPKIEMAVAWYDKAIKDFSGSSAARTAYEGKMQALMGWKEPGQYGSKFGIEADPAKYTPALVETFRAYEMEFADAPSAQAFRYQIAQVYWKQKNWDQTRAWLNEVIAKDSGANSFYKDLAERRLQKVEF